MKKTTWTIMGMLLTYAVFSQDLKEKDIPQTVKTALNKQFPTASKVSWEKEKGNYEANWGGRSGEDNSAQFTPSGNFLELVQSISAASLPAKVAPYVNEHYSKAKIREAGKVIYADGKRGYEVEIKGKDLIFDQKGNFLKEDR